MTRPIKFRAWDAKYKVMLEMGVKADGTPLLQGSVARGFLSHTFFDPSLELMQFTGLFDKNGKEIYEGDMLTNPRGEMKRGEVKFLNGMFVLAQGSDFNCLQINDQMEVIGNIYENSER
jgi:YopX protein.